MGIVCIVWVPGCIYAISEGTDVLQQLLGEALWLLSGRRLDWEIMMVIPSGLEISNFWY